MYLEKGTAARGEGLSARAWKALLLAQSNGDLRNPPKIYYNRNKNSPLSWKSRLWYGNDSSSFPSVERTHPSWKSTLIRQKFVDYFKSTVTNPWWGSSLIQKMIPPCFLPMQEWINLKYFLRLRKRDYNRAVSVQKCVRAGGKHNDLENVGFTARHHTFFEMLGNFSFGDYFKKMRFILLGNFWRKELQIPKEKLLRHCFPKRTTKRQISGITKKVCLANVFSIWRKDNFWRMGWYWPCGPCSEIFYDHGPKAGKESDPYKGIAAGEDRFVEIWNLVFMQFLKKLLAWWNRYQNPSVDTGSGFERLVAAMQGKLVCQLWYGSFSTHDSESLPIGGLPIHWWSRQIKGSKSFEVTSALRGFGRSLSDPQLFLIADGALPSNEGRGYVLRRILRRGIHMDVNFPPHSLLPAMIEALIPSMKDAYPELEARREMILTTVREEETRFSVDFGSKGTHLLQESLNRLKTQNQNSFLAILFSNFMIPMVSLRIWLGWCLKSGASLDEEQFEKEMQLAKG